MGTASCVGHSAVAPSGRPVAVRVGLGVRGRGRRLLAQLRRPRAPTRPSCRARRHRGRGHTGGPVGRAAQRLSRGPRRRRTIRTPRAGAVPDPRPRLHRRRHRGAATAARVGPRGQSRRGLPPAPPGRIDLGEPVAEPPRRGSLAAPAPAWATNRRPPRSTGRVVDHDHRRDNLASMVNVLGATTSANARSRMGRPVAIASANIASLSMAGASFRSTGCTGWRRRPAAPRPARRQHSTFPVRRWPASTVRLTTDQVTRNSCSSTPLLSPSALSRLAPKGDAERRHRVDHAADRGLDNNALGQEVVGRQLRQGRDSA